MKRLVSGHKAPLYSASSASHCQAIYKYKIKRALQLYKEGIGSLGFIADKLRVPKRDLIREFRQRRMEPAFSESTIYEEPGE